MEVEMYFNIAPWFSGRDIADFVLEHPNAFLHVKYAYFEDNKDLKRCEAFNFFNDNPGFPLFITPFTDGDWRVLHRHIAQLAEQQMEECILKKMKDVEILKEEKVDDNVDNNAEDNEN